MKRIIFFVIALLFVFSMMMCKSSPDPEQMAKEAGPGTKAGKARARKLSLALSKLHLEYRKVSINN